MNRLPINTEPINIRLEELRAAIGADAVFLVDVGGFMLAGTPTGQKFDLESMASLSAGNYLSGTELAKLFRIDGFQSFFLGSEQKVDYFQIGGEGIFLAVLQPRKAPLSEVIEHCRKTIETIHALFAKAARDARGADVVLPDRRMLFSTPPTSDAAQTTKTPDDKIAFDRCSFCGKSANQVGKLVRGRYAMICDECIRTMSEVLLVDLF